MAKSFEEFMRTYALLGEFLALVGGMRMCRRAHEDAPGSDDDDRRGVSVVVATYHQDAHDEG